MTTVTPLQTPQIVTVPFHGDDVLTTEVDGRPHVVLKPALESIGLDYWGQIERLRRRSWATTRMTQVVASDGKARDMLVADVRTFLMLLATVDENRVAADVRPKLVMYQAEVADAIEAYWTKGGAINPRATGDQLAGIADLAQRQAAVLNALAGIVDPAWLESKARHLAARALGEDPADDPARRPLTVGEYLEDRGVPSGVARKAAPRFGKRLKAAYVEIHGQQPGTGPRYVDGALRDVAVYTEADRNLFDIVFHDLVEEKGMEV
jgi:hypothetical protein